MTTDEQREIREPQEQRPTTANTSVRRTAGDTGRTPGGLRTQETAPTQMGQVIQELGRLTRRLTTSNVRTRGRTAARSTARTSSGGGHRSPPPSRERLAGLLSALGETGHPLHAQAVDEFIAIGDAAVPTLTDALQSSQSWLTAYRAAEALGQIGDGRATGALMQALHHSNSNVRWSAVRALSQIGDARTIFQLRRVAQNDRGKTSWGESVAGAAQSALDQLQHHSPLGQGVELLKTAVTCVLMILALVLAFGVASSLRQELDRVGEEVIDAGVLLGPRLRTTPVPTSAAAAIAPTTAASAPTEAVAPTTAVPQTGELTGSVLQQANVRSVPSSTQNEPIGRVNPGDEIIFLAVTGDRQWYRIRLGTRFSDKSSIKSDDGSGWINQALVSQPSGTVPLEEVNQ